MDKNYIKGLTQNILKKEFSNNVKTKIIEYNDRLNIACPYCGDSHKNVRAKRGNIYFNSLFYVCFNCDKKTTFHQFCKDYNEAIDPEHKLEMIEHLNNVLTYKDYSDDFLNAKLNDLIDFNIIEKILNSGSTNISDFRPIVKNSGVYKYLINRNIIGELQKNIYQAKYWKNEDEFEWVIILLNKRDDKTLGLQIRNLKKGKRRWFKIWNYEYLLTLIEENLDVIEDGTHTINTEDLKDMNKIVIYNKLSYFFNILNVNFTRTITIFEGYLDSLFFPNSIGFVGANTDAKFLENNNLDIRYFFDNDEKGFLKSEEKIEKFPVFLWKKLFTDIVDKKNPYDKERLYYRINKIKDLNELNIFILNAYIKLNLEKYFSKDILDKKWIPRVNKKKKYNNNKNYNWKFNTLDQM